MFHKGCSWRLQNSRYDPVHGKGHAVPAAEQVKSVVNVKIVRCSCTALAVTNKHSTVNCANVDVDRNDMLSKGEKGGRAISVPWR